MRVIYLLALLCGIVTTTENQTMPKTVRMNESSSVVLKAEVQSFEVKSETSTSIDLMVKLEMSLLNSGLKPVFFLRTKPPEIRGWALAKSTEALSNFDNISFDYFGESVDTSPEWSALRKALDKPSPPTDTVHILQPNESWKWIETASISLPRSDKDKNDYSKTESWESVKDLPAVWLSAICQVWSLNLEPKKGQTDTLFGYKLQKRWKSVGLLLVDDMRSEPVMLDLKTAVVR